MSDTPRSYMQGLNQSIELIKNCMITLLNDYENNPENLSSFINLVKLINIGV